MSYKINIIYFAKSYRTIPTLIAGVFRQIKKIDGFSLCVERLRIASDFVRPLRVALSRRIFKFKLSLQTFRCNFSLQAAST